MKRKYFIKTNTFKKYKNLNQVLMPCIKHKKRNLTPFWRYADTAFFESQKDIKLCELIYSFLGIS